MRLGAKRKDYKMGNESNEKSSDVAVSSSALLDKIKACQWDDGDWVIAFGNCPIGCCMSMNEAKAIERWLKGNGASLMKLMSND